MDNHLGYWRSLRVQSTLEVPEENIPSYTMATVVIHPQKLTEDEIKDLTGTVRDHYALELCKKYGIEQPTSLYMQAW